MAYWDGAPSFASGQGLSAAAGLDYLADAERILFDRLTSYNRPTWGHYLPAAAGATYVLWTLRHKSDLFYYAYEAADGQVELRINGTLVPGTQNTAPGSWTAYSGTADISGLGLVVGEFYTVSIVTATGAVIRVWHMYETLSQSYPTLAAFTDGTTPTAAQWQALSTYAGMLHIETNYPRPLVGGDQVQSIAPGRLGILTSYLWVGGFRRQGATLFLRCRLMGNYNSSTHQVNLLIYVNEALADTLTHNSIVDTEYSSALDLATLGIAVGDHYTVRCEVTTADNWDDVVRGTVQEVLELPADTPTIASYSQPPTWTMGDYVAGNSGAKQVATLKDNLTALRAVACYQNCPAGYGRVRASNEDTPLYGRRLHRWLHYTNQTGGTATLHYSWKGEEKTLTLPAANSVWLAYDLSSVEGLVAGTRYWLTGVYQALEDDVL